MKLVRETSPYLRKNISVKRMMMDVIIALLPLLVFSIVQFGFRALLVSFISVFVMVTSELFYCKYLVKKTITINNFLVPIISGLIYSFLLPSTTSIYVVIVGALFGIGIGKLVFGGTGFNIVNPAAIGRCFVGLCFGQTLTYNNVISSGTALGQVKEIGLSNFHKVLENYSLSDLFLGNVPGSMGEVCKLLILLSGCYLFIRKSADIRVFLSCIVTFIVLCFIGALKLDLNVFDFVLFQLFTGGILFGAVFMITDPVTSPITQRGRILFGILIAGLTVLIRFFGAYPEGMAFSILIFNLCVPLMDYHSLAKNKFTLKYSLFTGFIVLFFITTILVAL